MLDKIVGFGRDAHIRPDKTIGFGWDSMYYVIKGSRVWMGFYI